MKITTSAKTSECDYMTVKAQPTYYQIPLDTQGVLCAYGDLVKFKFSDDNVIYTVVGVGPDNTVIIQNPDSDDYMKAVNSEDLIHTSQEKYLTKQLETAKENYAFLEKEYLSLAKSLTENFMPFPKDKNGEIIRFGDKILHDGEDISVAGYIEVDNHIVVEDCAHFIYEPETVVKIEKVAE